MQSEKIVIEDCFYEHDRKENIMNSEAISLIIGIAICIVVAVLSYSGRWIPNRYGTGTMWLIILVEYLGLNIWFK